MDTHESQATYEALVKLAIANVASSELILKLTKEIEQLSSRVGALEEQLPAATGRGKGETSPIAPSDEA